MNKHSYHSSEDAWFLEKLKSMPLASEGLRSHPTRAVLHAYLHNRLPDRWLSAEELQAEAKPWTLTAVSQHVLHCPRCQSEIAQMRRALLQNRWDEVISSLSSPQAVFTHLRALALVVAILLLLNGMLLMLFPAPGGKFIPCSTLIKSLQYKGESAEKSGPPVVDLDANRLCWSSSAGQMWQTWWAWGILAIWLPLLLLHILWVWANHSELQRQREWA
ncbi:MAG: hypothetical protein NZO41_01875 [Candidatus Bipolaricaulota bacterium]|nr:hypothetical protein [Candidatus Bipolaricaulota bacterium]MDW8141018.1 hypothetical protein [Candidatus Bipolaricaulota bacterium]